MVNSCSEQYDKDKVSLAMVVIANAAEGSCTIIIAIKALDNGESDSGMALLSRYSF